MSPRVGDCPVVRARRTIARPTRLGFTLVEVGVALLIGVVLLVTLVEAVRGGLWRFVAVDQTTAVARDLALVLAQLRSDVTAAEGDRGPGFGASPDTGPYFPKLTVHAVGRPDRDDLTLYTFAMGPAPTPLPSDHPLARRIAAGHPLTGRALSDAGLCQSALAWTPSPDGGAPARFVVTARHAGIRSTITWALDPKARALRRTGPDGEHDLARGKVEEFMAWPVIEFLDPGRDDRPLLFLKCWVELRLRLVPPARASGPSGRTADLATRIIPRALNAAAHQRPPF